MDSNGNSTLAKIPIKPIVSTIGFIPMLFWFARFNTLFVGTEEFSIFQIVRFFDEIKEVFNSEVLDILKPIIIIITVIVAVLLICTVLVIVFSFLNGKKRSIVPLAVSAVSLLAAIASILVFRFGGRVYFDDVEFTVQIIEEGYGFYAVIAADVICIIVAIIELVLAKPKDAVQNVGGQNQYQYAANAQGYGSGNAGGYANQPQYGAANQNPMYTPQGQGYSPMQQDSVQATMPVSYSATGKITGIKGMYAGYEFPLRSGETLFIGKNPQECQIVIDQSVGSYVSRKHCSISYNNQRGNYTVIDYSTNGVFLDTGDRIQNNTPVALDSQTNIYLGDMSNGFKLG